DYVHHANPGTLAHCSDVPHPPVVSFFLHDPPTTEIYTLSLHDALPILRLVAPATGVTGAAGVRRPAWSRCGFSSTAGSKEWGFAGSCGARPTGWDSAGSCATSAMVPWK